MNPYEEAATTPDALAERLLQLNREMPGGVSSELKAKVAGAEGSGTPVYLDDADVRSMVERLIQVRDQLTVGELLDSIRAENLGERHATLSELMRVADTGMDLFLAAIGHRDVTEEVLEEARAQWGPLVDVALALLGLGHSAS